MRTESLSRESFLGSLPIAIYAIGMVVSWLWSPILFERTEYPLFALVVLVILLVGAGWGVVQWLPLWSLSWVVFSIWGISSLIKANVAESAASPRDYGVDMSLVSLATLFLIIIIVSVVSFRGLRFAMFAILLSLLYVALRFPILGERPALSSGTANTMTWVFATAAVTEAAFAVFIIARFLGSQGKLQIRFLYLLAAIIFVDPFLTGLSFILSVSGGSFLDHLLSVISITGGTWGSTGVMLLLAWGVSKLTLRLIRRRVLENNP